ncbi:HEAT repeat domain-containing protein [Halomontanus rarus]|uniref:HEAT repeat domain-containing protein n=1 Tax=Halomontanus rarus TaxID=3034020 RepID=UPI0023E808A4|nr:HEAT repeat domain-containing protein [Halovivax sp. TS33]
MSGGGGESDQREVPIGVDGLDLPSILAGLDADDPETRREAVTTVRAVVEDRPAACAPTVPKLRALLERSEIDYRDQIIACLAALAADSPTDVAPSTAEIVSFAASTSSSEARTTAFRCLGAIATRRPSAVVEHVETLVAAVRAEPDERGLTLLSQLARTHPDAFFPAISVLVTALESDAVEVRVAAARTIARVAAGDGTVVDHARVRARLRERLADDEPTVRRNACLALGYGGAFEARERLETVARTDPDVTVRNCASWAVAEFEDRDPDAESEPDSDTDTDLGLVSDVDSRSRVRSDPSLPSPFRAESDRRSELELE